MGNVLKETLEKVKGLKVPKANNRTVQIILGIINFFFFGWGTIIAGIIDGSVPDILIGLLQFVIPFAGWIWSIVWGILMVAGKD